jgi:hypothetical protein
LESSDQRLALRLASKRAAACGAAAAAYEAVKEATAEVAARQAAAKQAVAAQKQQSLSREERLRLRPQQVAEVTSSCRGYTREATVANVCRGSEEKAAAPP